MRKFRAILTAVVLGLIPSAGHAIVLDWNSVTWSNGALTGSFDIDPSNPGNDITITITGDTGFFDNQNNTGATAPVVDNTLTGGQGNSQKSLILEQDWSSRNQNITVTITFNYTQGVSNVAYTIFDIDADTSNNGYDDKVSKIVATSTTGALVAPTLTGSADNTISGSGTNRIVVGDSGVNDDQSGGNLSVNFGTNAITSMTFTYGNDSSAPKDPSHQWIGLYDISYTPRPRIPEVGTGLVAALACLGFIGLRWLRRRQPVLSSP